MAVYYEITNTAIAPHEYQRNIKNKKYNFLEFVLDVSLARVAVAPVAPADVQCISIPVNAKKIFFKSFAYTTTTYITANHIVSGDDIILCPTFFSLPISEVFAFAVTPYDIATANVGVLFQGWLQYVPISYIPFWTSSASGNHEMQIHDNFEFAEPVNFLNLYYSVITQNMAVDLTNTEAATAQMLGLNSATFNIDLMRLRKVCTMTYEKE